MLLGALIGSSILLNSAQLQAAKQPVKLLVIGIDGVSLNILKPMIEHGVTPNLGRIAKQGVRGHLESVWPMRTPQVWTTIATGKLAGHHGIWDHLSNTYFNPPQLRTKQKHPVTRTDRKSEALWGILGRQGFKSLSVGWMATWPAEKVPNGVMVAPIELMGDRRQTTIKGSFYKGAKHMVTPASYEALVQSLIVDPSQISDEDLKGFADIPKPNDSFFQGLDPLKRYLYGLSWSLARAQSVEKITLALLEKQKPDVLFSYFQCPDSLLHRFWLFHQEPKDIARRLKTHAYRQDASEELHQRFGRVVESCYRDVDERVGRILEAAQDANTLVFIVSDHGFGYAPVPHRMRGEPFSGDHLDDGIIIVAGPGIAHDAVIENATVTDITPTILHGLGLKVAQDMEGKVLTKIWKQSPGPIRYQPTYEKKAQKTNPYPQGWPPRKHPRRSADQNPTFKLPHWQ
jgi:hypothetical protein